MIVKREKAAERNEKYSMRRDNNNSESGKERKRFNFR
jgi:hypothetical protein